MLAALAVAIASAGGAQPARAGASAQGPATANRFVLAPATTVAGTGIAEVSGLAWDAGAHALYAVSDQGRLYRFRIQLRGDSIVSVQPVAAAALTDRGKPVNAEGLAVRRAGNGGGSELVVALEATPPRIARFGPDGALRGELPVPAPANDDAHYAKSKKGRIKHGLESVALHPGFGLMTAPESPLQARPGALHTIYADGRAWSFPRYTGDSRLKGFEVLPDGNLVVLERSRNGDSKDLQVASLRRVDIGACDAHGVCQTTLVATLPPGPENFEGMTLIDGHHLLLASDNGGDATLGTVFALVVLP